MIFPLGLKLKQQRGGFTFLEMLISVFLLSVMTVAVSGVYVGFTNLQARSRSYERLLNDSNYALELMAREFRNNAIFDYTPSDSCSTLLGADHPNECLILIRSDNTLEAFMIYGPDNNLYFITPECDEEFTSCTWADNVENYTILLGVDLNGIRVQEGSSPLPGDDGLRFRVFPSDNPFASDTGANRQPLVVMQLRTEYPDPDSNKAVRQILQTAVSARIYRR